MAPKPQLYESDDTTPFADLTFTLNAGASSSVYTFHLWNDIGGALGADTLSGARLKAFVYDGADWVDFGEPALDQQWGRFTLVGYDNTGDPTFVPDLTGTYPIGTNQQPLLPDIPQDCAIYGTIQWKAPGDASGNTVSVKIRVVFDEASAPVAPKLGFLSGDGVIPEARRNARRVIYGGGITTDGSDTIVVDPMLLAYDGAVVCQLEQSHALNQNDGAASALASGESYIAVISADSSAVTTATKGNKSSSTPTPPAVPTDEVFIRYVTVTYEAGGTSVIEAADLSGSFSRGEFLVEAGSGLNVTIGVGTGLSSTDLYQFHSAASTVAVAASDTNYIWKHPDGTFSANVTGIIPVIGSTLLAEADTDGSGVTAIRDRRPLIDLALYDFEMRLDLGTVTGTGTHLDYGVLPGDMDLVRWRLEGKTNTAGSSGSYDFDVNYLAEGAPITGTPSSIFTSQDATYMPTLAYNASDLSVSGFLHEVRRFTAGARFSADCDAVPAGSPSLAGARIYLYFRRYR